jgi:hypothetical protein
MENLGVRSQSTVGSQAVDAMNSFKAWAIALGHRLGLFHPVFPAFGEPRELKPEMGDPAETPSADLTPAIELNPATGLPMIFPGRGGYDVGGSAYGSTRDTAVEHASLGNRDLFDGI